jgi:hypothetical protein
VVEHEGEERFSEIVVMERDCDEQEWFEVGGVSGRKEEGRKRCGSMV